MATDVHITGYRMGALADVLKLHTSYYGDQWGFGLQFETLVASEMARFLTAFDPALDQFLVAYDKQGTCLGSVSVNGSRESPGALASLRWFIVDRRCVGKGLGRRLLTQVLAHCDAQGVDELRLSTFSGLDAARALYESAGFSLVEELDSNPWSGGVREQRFVRNRPLA